MFKLSSKLLLSRKKWLLTMSLSLALMISAISSIHTASESIKYNLIENSYSIYGEHTGALININANKEELSKKTNKVGQYHIETTIDIKEDVKATVGWMDTDAINMGRIKLIEGVYPKSKGEVAIEEAYLKLIDEDWKIGEQKKLQFEDAQKVVTLTGVIQNYSSKWTVPYDVEKGLNDFPNIFIPHKDTELSSKINNFLFLFEGSKKSVEEDAYELINQYEESEGIFNEGLYYKGLIDYETISILSFVFQILCLISATFCILNLFSYYNLDQSKKFAAMKATGALNVNLYKICINQCAIIFILGLTLSIPLQAILHILIIKHTYGQGQFHLLSLSFVGIFLIILFVILIINSILSIERVKHTSINNVLRGISASHSYIWKYIQNIKNIKLKQFAIQVMPHPKQFIFTVIVLCIATLTLNFSIFLQKESAGVWDSQQAYYISSQEGFTYDVMDGLNVLSEPGITFKPEKVKELKSIDGIKFVEKEPFMMDVHPSLNPNLITSNLQDWINEQDTEEEGSYNGNSLIPNVKYILLDKQEFDTVYKQLNYTDFIGKVIIHNPGTIDENRKENSLDNENINFIQKFFDSNSLHTREWKYEILQYNNYPFRIKIDDSLSIEEDNQLTIVMSEETALSNHMFQGYKDLSIYVEDNLSAEKKESIESFLLELTATIPGSMYQNIPEFMMNDTKISNLVGFYGKLAFAVSAVLSILTLVVVVFSKYMTQKRRWGIYLSLGYTEKKVLRSLQLELLVYLIIATLLSLSIYLIVLLKINHIYPTYQYLYYFIISTLVLFALLTIGSLFLGTLINKESIYSMIREKE
ncbi:ABC transporter permease [Virgibacillus dokdonensis]|uniref:FtsX-like permease family protein n=1 Tax=Virgibacillus dokdonensis TaxID=302167 RepID=A0A2K9IZJ0_9BACI|nr:ABC transporter permease [Virgibacillus dokdonensis]AUJ24875.1 FtsX-like permease family protein [Virgibacillus dokdonensis]